MNFTRFRRHDTATIFLLLRYCTTQNGLIGEFSHEPATGQAPKKTVDVYVDVPVNAISS